MNKIYIFGCLSVFTLAIGEVGMAALQQSENKVWEETILSPEGSFQVKIDTKEKEVEVVQEKSANKPAHLRLRILRQNERPIEVRLHLTEKPEDPFRYTGKANQWNGSLIGFELEWSFDKKTWKKLGKSLGKLLP